MIVERVWGCGRSISDRGRICGFRLGRKERKTSNQVFEDIGAKFLRLMVWRYECGTDKLR